MWLMCILTPARAVAGFSKSQGSSPTRPPFFIPAINALAPSYYTTELTGAIRKNEERSTALLARIPAGRYGEPEDLKGAVVLLSSAAGNFIHGSVPPVDGGDRE